MGEGRRIRGGTAYPPLGYLIASSTNVAIATRSNKKVKMVSIMFHFMMFSPPSISGCHTSCGLFAVSCLRICRLRTERCSLGGRFPSFSRRFCPSQEHVGRRHASRCAPLTGTHHLPQVLWLQSYLEQLLSSLSGQKCILPTVSGHAARRRQNLRREPSRSPVFSAQSGRKLCYTTLEREVTYYKEVLR